MVQDHLLPTGGGHAEASLHDDLGHMSRFEEFACCTKPVGGMAWSLS